MRLAGMKQDTLGRRRLSGVDVRGNADVPVVLDRGVPRHDRLLGLVSYQR